MIQQYLTITAAAEQFGISRQRMHVLIQKYEVPTVRINPRLLMVKKADLKRIPKKRPTGKHRG